MWKVLVKDAGDTLDVAATHEGGITTSPDDLVRGLCRMALDNALREFIVRTADRFDRDTREDLKRLDKAGTTKDRIKAAKKLHPTSTAPSTAEQHVARYFEAWNAASHGQPSTSPADMAEVEVARSACSVLAP